MFLTGSSLSNDGPLDCTFHRVRDVDMKRDYAFVVSLIKYLSPFYHRVLISLSSNTHTHTQTYVFWPSSHVENRNLAILVMLMTQDTI